MYLLTYLVNILICVIKSSLLNLFFRFLLIIFYSLVFFQSAFLQFYSVESCIFNLLCHRLLLFYIAHSLKVSARILVLLIIYKVFHVYFTLSYSICLIITLLILPFFSNTGFILKS